MTCGCIQLLAIAVIFSYLHFGPSDLVFIIRLYIIVGLLTVVPVNHSVISIYFPALFHIKVIEVLILHCQYRIRSL